MRRLPSGILADQAQEALQELRQGTPYCADQCIHVADCRCRHSLRLPLEALPLLLLWAVALRRTRNTSVSAACARLCCDCRTSAPGLAICTTIGDNSLALWPTDSSACAETNRTIGGVPWLLDRPRGHADEEAGAVRSYREVTVTVTRTVRVLRPLSALQRIVDSAAPVAYVCHSLSLRVTLTELLRSGPSRWPQRPFVGFGCGRTEGPNHTRSECSTGLDCRPCL